MSAVIYCDTCSKTLPPRQSANFITIDTNNDKLVAEVHLCLTCLYNKKNLIFDVLNPYYSPMAPKA
jgi:hypothetical protein